MTAFTRVVEAGSFSRAADSLRCPKARVTRLIQWLETDLGVRLLQRTTRTISLTVEGATYYERVVPLLAELEEMDTLARGAVVQTEGHVRISTPPLLASALLAPALAGFHARHPGVGVEVLTTNRLADLVADHIDCAIRVGRAGDASVDAQRIGEYRFITCASPAYLARHGTPHTPDDLLQGHVSVALISGRGSPLPLQFARDVRDTPREVTVPRVLLVDDSNAHLAAGLSGLGLIQVSSWFVERALQRGELVQLLPEWSHTPARQVHLVRPNGRAPSAAARVFMEWIEELVRGTASAQLKAGRRSTTAAEGR